MTKQELAKNITGKYEAGRTIVVNKKLNFNEGEFYQPVHKVESWTDINDQLAQGYEGFVPEQNGNYVYVLICEDVPAYKVDYENEEVVELLDAYEEECELLVDYDNVKMQVVSGATDEDAEEMGYYEITLKAITK